MQVLGCHQSFLMRAWWSVLIKLTRVIKVTVLCVCLQGVILLAPAVDITQHWMGILTSRERQEAQVSGVVRLRSEYDPVSALLLAREFANHWLVHQGQLAGFLVSSLNPRPQLVQQGHLVGCELLCATYTECCAQPLPHANGDSVVFFD